MAIADIAVAVAPDSRLIAIGNVAVEERHVYGLGVLLFRVEQGRRKNNPDHGECELWADEKREKNVRGGGDGGRRRNRRRGGKKGRIYGPVTRLKKS